MINLLDLEEGQDFTDKEILGIDSLQVMIVEDHVYVITDKKNLVIASDNGNGYGKVLEVCKFNSEYEFNEFIEQNWKKYLHNKKYKAYYDSISF